LAILKHTLNKFNESLDKFLLCERLCLITNDKRINYIKNYIAFCYFKLSKRGTFSTGVNLTNIAERYYLELYEDDFPETCANLGMFYLLRQNTVEGIKYLTEGIEKKCGRSFNSLATHYINYNLQDKQDEIEQLFQKAIEYGYTRTYYNFAEYYSKNVNKPELAKDYYIKAAEHEIKESFYKLANIYASEQNIKLYIKCIYNGYINDCKLCSEEFNTINHSLLVGLLKDLAHSNEIRYNSCIKGNNFSDLEIRDIFKTQLLKPVLRTVKHDSLEDGQTTPKRVYTPNTMDDDIEQIDDIECCICYEYDSLLKTKCGHIICSDCIDKIETTDCPMCRTNLI
jgi:tetratricopeptide (TPR) repeat protein